MSGTNTPTNAACAHFVKLYKIKLSLALAPIVSENMKNNFCPPSFWTN